MVRRLPSSALFTVSRWRRNSSHLVPGRASSMTDPSGTTKPRARRGFVSMWAGRQEPLLKLAEPASATTRRPGLDIPSPSRPPYVGVPWRERLMPM